MKKKVLAGLMAAMMTVTMAGCGSAAQSTAAGSSAAAGSEETAEGVKEITVAGIVFQDDQNMALMRKGYEDAVADAGAGVKLLEDNTNQDQSKETELINTYVSQKIDGIAIAPLNADASVASLKSAAESGLKITLTNIDLADSDFIVAGYTSDDHASAYQAGLDAAEIIKEKYGEEKVNVGIVQFQSLLPAQSGARVKGYTDAFDEAGINYEIVADQDGLNTDEALEKASGILNIQPGIKCICLCSRGRYTWCYRCGNKCRQTG